LPFCPLSPIVIPFDLTFSALVLFEENGMEEAQKNAATPEVMREALVNMATESWRFSRLVERLLTKLDAGEQSRYVNQLRWFIKKIEESLEQSGLTIVSIEGQIFDPGMAATPVNLEDFSSQDVLVVDQMLEPIIMGKNGIIKTGSITLRKVES
jgi:hypothetical protein